MSHKENKSHEEKASGFKKNDLILVLLVFVAAGIFFAGHLFTSQKSAGVVEIQIDGKEHRADRERKSENGSGQLSGSDLCTPESNFKERREYYLPSE